MLILKIILFNFSFFSSDHKNRRKRKENNMNLILIGVVILFFICHFPRILFNAYKFLHFEDYMNCKLVKNLYHYPYKIRIVKEIHDLFIMLNSALNFFIYFLVGQKFRKAFFQTLGLRRVSLYTKYGHNRVCIRIG